MRFLADLVYLLAGLLYLPFALYNALVLRKNRGGWAERFGAVPRFAAGRTRVWIHAVSLGEMNATSTLAAALGERLPEAEIVFSTTTDTGYARGVALYGAERVFRYPLDFSVVVARALGRVRPSLIVLMELEVWPNLVRMATARGIPVAIANGRLTPRSARRLQRLGPVCRAMFRPLAWVGAQDEAIARGFLGLGVMPDRIAITSSLKWDTASIVESVLGASELARACGLSMDRPIWVCGSTGPGEEEVVLDAYELLRRKFEGRSSKFEEKGTKARRHEGTEIAGGTGVADAVWDTNRVASAPRSDMPRLVVVPRKPERFAEVAALIERRGLRCVRRTVSPDGTERIPLTTGDVVLGDTMGELRKFYSLCAVAFVGRSLVPMGGSDTMEVAALGKPVIVGPHNDNFREAFEALRAERALKVVESAESLVRAVEDWLSDPENANLMGDRARHAVRSRQGATVEIADALVRLLRG